MENPYFLMDYLGGEAQYSRTHPNSIQVTWDGVKDRQAILTHHLRIFLLDLWICFMAWNFALKNQLDKKTPLLKTRLPFFPFTNCWCFYSFSHNHGSGKWLYLKDSYYWRDPFFTFRIMGVRVNLQKPVLHQNQNANEVPKGPKMSRRTQHNT